MKAEPLGHRRVYAATARPHCTHVRVHPRAPKIEKKIDLMDDDGRLTLEGEGKSLEHGEHAPAVRGDCSHSSGNSASNSKRGELARKTKRFAVRRKCLICRRCVGRMYAHVYRSSRR